MTTQETGGMKTAALRKPTIDEILATGDKVLIPEEDTVVNRVGSRGFQ